jgi:hypothetical protein
MAHMDKMDEMGPMLSMLTMMVEMDQMGMILPILSKLTTSARPLPVVKMGWIANARNVPARVAGGAVTPGVIRR